jgi:hypothetical protein
MGTKESYLPAYRLLSDAELLAPPRAGAFSELEMFVCTYEASLGNLHMDFRQLTAIVCGNLREGILAVNSNFGHACLPGHEDLLKEPKPVVESSVPSCSRVRKLQGDGTCFNSAVEVVVRVDHPLLPAGKVYSVKCFPSTGKTQVPGSILPDRADAHLVLVEFVAYLNDIGVGDVDDSPEAATLEVGVIDAEAAPATRKTITIDDEGPTMINFKFRLNRNAPRILVNPQALSEYMCMLETAKCVVGASVPDSWPYDEWPQAVLPPYLVRETKSAQDDVKVSFGMRIGGRVPRINVFQGGKVNILGASTDESAQLIYEFFVDLFSTYWDKLVTIQPKRDSELKSAKGPAPARQKEAEAAPAADPLTDEDIDAILASLDDAPPDPVRDILESLDEWDRE